MCFAQRLDSDMTIRPETHDATAVNSKEDGAQEHQDGREPFANVYQRHGGQSNTARPRTCRMRDEARFTSPARYDAAMVAMLFTAVSYGRMARVYPSAGSAFTYVGRELHPLGGYVVGWSMLMDYMLNPIICAVWCAVAANGHYPSIP